jgi:hypothetical protein
MVAWHELGICKPGECKIGIMPVIMEHHANQQRSAAALENRFCCKPLISHLNYRQHGFSGASKVIPGLARDAYMLAHCEQQC